MAIDAGMQTFGEIQRFTNIEETRLKSLLKIAIEADVVEAVEQGGKSDAARGQRKIIFRRKE